MSQCQKPLDDKAMAAKNPHPFVRASQIMLLSLLGLQGCAGLNADRNDNQYATRNDVSTLQNQAETLQTQVESLRSQFGQLQNTIEQISQKTNNICFTNQMGAVVITPCNMGQ